MASGNVVRVLEDITYDNFADYGGSDRKNGIILDGERYMVKFQERDAPRNANQTGNVNNVVAEYLSSHIAATLGLPVHETLIVSIDGELAVRTQAQRGVADDRRRFRSTVAGVPWARHAARHL